MNPGPIITALVTPMTQDEKVDYASLKSLLEFQLTSGIKDFVILGSTGESLTLSLDEKLEIVRVVVELINKRANVIIGVNHASTQDSLEFINKLNQNSGIDALMLTTPYYIKPTQDGLYKHFMTLASFSEFPVLLYNVPSRTSCNLADDTILKLAEHSNVIGLKDATAELERMIYLYKYKPQRFKLYSGDDATFLPFMLAGGSGVISVTSNVLPQAMLQIAMHVQNFNYNDASRLNNSIFEIYRALFVESNPIPVKWLLYNMGLIGTPALRMPLTTLAANYQSHVEEVFNTINKELNQLNVI